MPKFCFFFLFFFLWLALCGCKTVSPEEEDEAAWEESRDGLLTQDAALAMTDPASEDDESSGRSYQPMPSSRPPVYDPVNFEDYDNPEAALTPEEEAIAEETFDYLLSDEAMAPLPTDDLPPSADPTSLPQFESAPPPELVDRAEWHTDPRVARKQSVREGKCLLFAFLATEWNSPSLRLQQSLFGSKEFNEYARQNLVITFLDFPRSWHRDEYNKEKAYRLFRKHFNVFGYPTVIILSPGGKVLKTMRGYSKRDGIKEYTTEIKEVVGSGVRWQNKKRR